MFYIWQFPQGQIWCQTQEKHERTPEEKAVAYFNLFFRQVQSCNKEPNDERAGKAKKTQLRNGIVSYNDSSNFMILTLTMLSLRYQCM